MGAEDEWIKEGNHDFECFEFDPANPKKPDPKEEASTNGTTTPSIELVSPSFAVEQFGGRLAHRGKLVDADTVKSCLQEEAKDVPVQAFESPVDRYWRLKHQIEAFQKSVQTLSKTPASIAATTQDLRRTDSEFGNALESSAACPWLPSCAPLTSQVVNEGTLPTPGMKLAHQARVAATGSSKREIFYEVSAQASQPYRLGALNAKVEAMEENLGNGDALFTNLTTVFAQLDLLSETRLTSLSYKIQDVIRELKMKDNRHQPSLNIEDEIEENPVHTRIDKVEALMKQWGPAIASLPSTVSSLRAKDEQHQRAVECILRLQRLKQRLALALQTATNDQTALASVTESLAQNLKVMAANVAALQERMKKLE